MRILVRIFECDRPGCDATRQSDLLPRDAIRAVRAAGWTVRKGRHFCPDHKPGGAS